MYTHTRPSVPLPHQVCVSIGKKGFIVQKEMFCLLNNMLEVFMVSYILPSWWNWMALNIGTMVHGKLVIFQLWLDFFSLVICTQFYVCCIPHKEIVSGFPTILRCVSWRKLNHFCKTVKLMQSNDSDFWCR